MKILITGNMGYVGPSVVQRLRQSYPAAEIFGLDTGYFAGCLAGPEIFPECRVDVQYFMDVRRVSPKLLGDVDVVVHLAAISNDPMGGAFEEATFDINYRASVELARKAKEVGVGTFVFASSCSVYGGSDGTARTEESLVDPLTAYAKSKVRTEEGLASLADATFKVTSLRFATACGMSERLRLDLVLNDFVASAVASKRITILSDGTPWRPLIHVKDMAKAIDWAIGRDADAGGEFLAINVGSDAWNYQVKELAQAVASAIPGVEISISEKAAPDRRSYRVSFELFKRLAPHHQPDYDLAATIAELERGLRRMRFRDRNFRDSSYIRLNVLSDLQKRGLLTKDLYWTFQRQNLEP